MNIDPSYRAARQAGKTTDKLDYFRQMLDPNRSMGQRILDEFTEAGRDIRLQGKVAVGKAKNQLNSWIQSLTTPKPKAPQLTRSQRELQDFRNFKNSQVQSQVNADAAAGGKALKKFSKKGLGPKNITLPKANALGRGNLLAGSLGLAELLIANSGTEYGNKVRAAGEAHEKSGNDAIAYAENFLNNLFNSDGRKAGQKLQQFSDLRGSITPGSVQPAATNLGEGAAMDAAERFRAGAGFPEGVIRPDDYPTLLKLPPNDDGGSGDSQLNDRGPSAAELTQDEGMRIWAEKFGTLAKQVKEGQAGFEVIQDTLYPKTEEGFANPDNRSVITSIDGQKLQEPMSINEFNAVQEVRDFDMKPTSVMSVLAQKDPQKALNEFMTANGLIAK